MSRRRRRISPRYEIHPDQIYTLPPEQQSEGPSDSRAAALPRENRRASGRRPLGPKQPGVATILNKLAELYGAQGRHRG